MKSFKQAGIWWLPETPDKTLTGTLTHSQTGSLRLNLIGNHLSDADDTAYKFYPSILGYTERGENVTLCLCQAERPGGTHDGKFTWQTVWAEQAYIGASFTGADVQLFNAAHIQFSHLLNWDQQSSFQHLPVSGQPWELGFTLTNPDMVIAETTRGNISIGYGHNSHFTRNKVEASRSAAISVEAKKELTINDWYLEFIYPLQNLLTLVTDTPNMVTSLSVSHKDIKYHDTNFPKPIRVLSGVQDQRQVIDNPLPPLFTLDQLPSDFSDLIERWLKFSTEMESVCSLYFGVLHNEKVFTTQFFLNMVQAAEAYHRVQFGVKNCDLIARLRTLVGIQLLVVPSYVGPVEDFVKKVRDTRNYYTHYSANLSSKAARGQELYYLAQALAVVMQSWFLRELGFSEIRVAQIIHTSSKHDYLDWNYQLSKQYVAQTKQA